MTFHANLASSPMFGRRGTVAVFGATLMVMSPPAFALGDPAVILWIGAGVLVQFALIMFVFFANLFRRALPAVLIGYLLLLALVWSWAWQSRAPVTLVGLALVFAPAVGVGAFTWVAKRGSLRVD
jgi:hypothetical protein